MSRFSQSANNFYSTIAHNRPATSNYKASRGRILSTGQTAFLPNNTNSQIRPSTGIMMRSSSSSFRNTKGKLQTLNQHLTDLLERCKDVRVSTKELQLQLNLLKQDLNERGIVPIHEDLVQKIKVLQKAVRIRQRSDMLKFDVLNQTCQALSRNSKQIRGRVHDLSERLLQIQNLMGFHGVRDRLKY